MGTGIQSNYSDLRDQLIVMFILAVAIALRFLFTGGSEQRSNVPTFPSTTSVQKNLVHDNNHSSSQPCAGPEPPCEFGGDDVQPDARLKKELQE